MKFQCLDIYNTATKVQARLIYRFMWLLTATVAGQCGSAQLHAGIPTLNGSGVNVGQVEANTSTFANIDSFKVNPSAVDNQSLYFPTLIKSVMAPAVIIR